MQTVTLTQASSRLGELIDAAVNGEEIVLANDGHAVRLVPVPASEVKSQPTSGSHKGLIKISEDFDERLEDSRDYMEPVE